MAAQFDPDAYLESVKTQDEDRFDPDAYLETHPEISPAPSPQEARQDLLLRQAGAAPWNQSALAAVAEGIANAGTAIPATMAGGMNFLGTLALSGGNVDAARAVQEQTQQALTYQPRTEPGQQVSGALAEGMSWLGPKQGEFLGESLADQGHPFLGAAANTAWNAIPMLAGAKALRREPGLGDAPRKPIFGDSAGAAAAAPDLLRNASPTIRARVEELSKRGPIDREAAVRTLEADSFGISLSKGEALNDAVQISKEQNSRAKFPDIARLYQQRERQLVDKFDEIRQEAAPTVVGNDHIQNGQQLVDAYKAYDQPVREQISALYKQLEDANGGQFPVDGAAFVKAADDALSKKLKGRYLPDGIKADILEFKDTGSMTFEQFENLRTNLAAESRKADRSGDGNAAAAIAIVREALESLPMTGEAATLKPIADAARTAARDRFQRMREDPAYRAAVDDPYGMGDATPLADDFVSKYVVKGKRANIEKMREALANDPAAMELIAASALNYIKAKSGVDLYTNNGNFNAKGFGRALAELTPKIDVILDPKTAERVQMLGNVLHYTQAQPRGSFVNNSNTLVSALGEHAASSLEGAVNLKAGGIPVGTYVRNKMKGRQEAKFMEESFGPGAGIVNLSDLAKMRERQ